MLQCGNSHIKIILNYTSQFQTKEIRLLTHLTSTFEGLRYREIDMVNSYN